MCTWWNGRWRGRGGKFTPVYVVGTGNGTHWLCVELIKRIFTARLTRIFTLYANMWNTINKGRQFARTHTPTHTRASCAKNFLSIKFYSKMNLHPGNNTNNNNNTSSSAWAELRVIKQHENCQSIEIEGVVRGGGRGDLPLALLSTATCTPPPPYPTPTPLLSLPSFLSCSSFSYCQCQRDRVINKMAQNGDTCCCKLEK